MTSVEGILPPQISSHTVPRPIFEDSSREFYNFSKAVDAHAIVACADLGGRITYVNDMFCTLSRYSREELIGQNHRIINSGVHPPQFFRDLWLTIRKGQVWKGDICNLAKDGTKYLVRTTIMPFFDSEGRLEQYVSVCTDITEVVEAQEKLKAARENLQALNEELQHERQILDHKNIALRELINQVEEEKDRIKLTMKQNLETTVVPLLERLRQRSPSQGEVKYIDLILESLETIAVPPMSHHSTLETNLTPKEFQICNMIKKGLSVKEIASFYTLSPRTIDKHRENIRKKLGLTTQKTNLSSYLLAKL